MGEVVEFGSGSTPAKHNADYWTGSNPWVSAKDMKQLFLDDTEDHISEAAVDDGAKQAPAGTVLVLTRGMTLFTDVPICVLRRPMSFNQDVKALQANGNLRMEFLPFLLLAAKQRILAMVDSAGHGTGRLSTDELKSLRVTYPHGPEQLEIAECLCSLDELIRAEGRKLEALKVYKKGLMQQLFPREGEAVPRLRLVGSGRAEAWQERRIGDVLCEVMRPVALVDDAMYALIIAKRRYGGLVSRGNRKGREIAVKSQFLVREDDFVISKRQIVHNACGLVSGSLDGSVVSNEYAIFRAKPNFDIRFFNYFVQQPAVSHSFVRCSVGIVIEKMLFKVEDWLKQKFQFPCLDEQKEIASCLSAGDELIAAQRDKIEFLMTLKKGLVAQLFPEPTMLDR